MDTFATGIYNMKLDDKSDFFASLHPELQTEVRVALIDDGVQFGHDSLQDKVVLGCSFDDGYDLGLDDRSMNLPQVTEPLWPT